MFPAFLCYQLTDLLVALALALLFARAAAAAPFVRLAGRFPRLLGTAVRRCLLLELPLQIVVYGVAIVVGRQVALPLLEKLLHGEPRAQSGVNGLSFLAFGVAFWSGAVVVPLRAAWLALRAPAADATARTRRARDRLLAALLLAAAGAFVWDATLREPRELVVEESYVALEHWPAGRPPLRVVLISDVQAPRLTAHERELVERVRALAPDLVLDAGDLLSQSFDPELPLAQARFVLNGLKAPLGLYVVNGDVDDAVDGGIRRTVEGTPAQLLDNRSVLIPGGPPIELIGLDPRDADAMRRVLAAPPRAALRLGLVHRPRFYSELHAAGCAAVFAGHTHGGQVVLPFFGPPITLEIVPRDVAAGGLHRMADGTQLYVTRGVGMEGGFAPPIRFRCPPEISLLTLGPPRR